MKFSNRKIKFRVWTGATMEYRVLAGALGYFYAEGMSNKDSACLSDANTIYPEETPLMQWTGLVDKNGKEIYEGDILEFSNSQLKYEIEFEHGEFIAYHLDESFNDEYMIKKGHFFHPWQWGNWNKTERSFIVVGNIFENPELLNAP